MRYCREVMERTTGFEPARPGWRPVQALKACVLPLHYARSMRYFFSTLAPKGQDIRSCQLSRKLKNIVSPLSVYLQAQRGFKLPGEGDDTELSPPSVVGLIENVMMILLRGEMDFPPIHAAKRKMGRLCGFADRTRRHPASPRAPHITCPK